MDWLPHSKSRVKMGGRAEYRRTSEINQKSNSEFSSHEEMKANTVQALKFILKQKSYFLCRDICQ